MACTRLLRRAYAAAPLVAGVVAQYLEQHPDASQEDVLRTLYQLATPDIVSGAGTAARNLFLYTNITAPGGSQLTPQPPAPSQPGQAAQPEAESGSGLTTGAAVGIAVGAIAGGLQRWNAGQLCTLLGVGAGARSCTAWSGQQRFSRRLRRAITPGQQSFYGSLSSWMLAGAALVIAGFVFLARKRRVKAGQQAAKQLDTTGGWQASLYFAVLLPL